MALNEAALTVAHVAVEDELIDMRDRCMSVLGPRNGFVVYDKGGVYNGVMRLGTRDGLRIAIEAYLAVVGHSCGCYSDPRDHEDTCPIRKAP